MQKQILVIEDDEILNAGLCYNLQKRDMLPFSAGSIEEAKKLMKQETFDLILLDINLPDEAVLILQKKRWRTRISRFFF